LFVVLFKFNSLHLADLHHTWIPVKPEIYLKYSYTLLIAMEKCAKRNATIKKKESESLSRSDENTSIACLFPENTAERA